MILRLWSENFFGDKEGKVEKFTGQNGKSFVNWRLKGEWGLKTFQGSMMPSWQNKLGASYMIKTHYSIEFLRPSFFHIVQLWRQLTQVQPHMRGKASLRAEKWYNGLQFGELGMSDRCQFGVIAGFRWNTPQKLYPLVQEPWQKQKLAPLLIVNSDRGRKKYWVLTCSVLKLK